MKWLSEENKKCGIVAIYSEHLNERYQDRKIFKHFCIFSEVYYAILG
jgi:hypothetical protein